MTMPDFDQWANNVIAEGLMTLKLEDKVKDALKQAFEQGYQLGQREGYGNGRDNSWWIEQEKRLRELSDLGQLQDAENSKED